MALIEDCLNAMIDFALKHKRAVLHIYHSVNRDIYEQYLLRICEHTHFAEQAGLPHKRIHDFRHSNASLLANEGINIQEIARSLGHSKIKQTWNTYSHLYPREEERAVQVLNRVK